jgi:nucleotide-binding universal stress UspA family protein
MATVGGRQHDPAAAGGSRGRVVVGVDGSLGSDVALEAAVREADLRGDVVRVVTAFTPEEEFGAWGNGAWAAVPPPDPERLRAAAYDMAERMVKDVLEKLAGQLRSDVTIDVEARPGHPARVLLDAAGDADQLFVGHRGRGAVSSFLLGSVGLHCVAGAPCPVTVVPQPDGAS